MIAGSLIGFFFEGRYEACYYLNDRGFNYWTSTVSCNSFPSKGQRPSIAIIFSSIVCFATFNAKDALSVDIFLFLFFIGSTGHLQIVRSLSLIFSNPFEKPLTSEARVVHQKMSKITVLSFWYLQEQILIVLLK